MRCGCHCSYCSFPGDEMWVSLFFLFFLPYLLFLPPVLAFFALTVLCSVLCCSLGAPWGQRCTPHLEITYESGYLNSTRCRSTGSRLLRQFFGLFFWEGNDRLVLVTIFVSVPGKTRKALRGVFGVTLNTRVI